MSPSTCVRDQWPRAHSSPKPVPISVNRPGGRRPVPERGVQAGNPRRYLSVELRRPQTPRTHRCGGLRQATGQPEPSTQVGHRHQVTRRSLRRIGHDPSSRLAPRCRLQRGTARNELLPRHRTRRAGSEAWVRRCLVYYDYRAWALAQGAERDGIFSGTTSRNAARSGAAARCSPSPR
jgi:hypothetical protein